MRNFCERIVVEVILEIYFTVKNFFLIAFCNDKIFFYLGKFDKALERRVLPAHLSKSIVSGICMTFLYSLYQISASSRKIIDLLSLLFRNNRTEYKNQVTECASLNNSYGTQKFMNLFNYWPGHLPIMLKHFSKCWWCTMYSNAKSHCLVV